MDTQFYSDISELPTLAQDWESVVNAAKIKHAFVFDNLLPFVRHCNTIEVTSTKLNQNDVAWF